MTRQTNTLLHRLLIALTIVTAQVIPSAVRGDFSIESELSRSGEGNDARDRQLMRINRGRRSVNELVERNVELTGEATLIFRGEKPRVENAEVHMNGEDTAVMFELARPSEVIEHYLRHLVIDGQPAALDQNVRVTAAVGGTIVLPHGNDYAALRTYREPNCRGDETGFVVHRYYRHEALGEDNDNINSFVLKRGYMATLAQNPDGTGVSKVYIARDGDLRVNRLPRGLADEVSFVRVFPWRYTGKRGLGGWGDGPRKLDAQWSYDWGAGGASSPDMEYVPMKHRRDWDSYDNINNKHNVTHLLGFNEPMQRDQANMSMQECLDLWPKLQASGLRLGSPCSTDGTIEWIYQFCDEADKRGLRVDFVAVHYYKGNWTTQQLIDWLRSIHERTGRPLWVTEWNNGAPWVEGHNPSQEENARKIAEYCRAMNEQPWIERYAIHSMGGGRDLFREDGLSLVGEAYRRVPLVEAYTQASR